MPSAMSAPRVAEVFRGSCVVSWQPPLNDGGSPLTGYLLERRAGTSSQWVRAIPYPISETSVHLTDLVEGNMFEFRVIAENQVGATNPSAASQPVIARDPWDKPSMPGALKVSDITRRSCLVSWTAPTSDGGDMIRDYAVEYRPVDSYRWIRANEGERTTDGSYKVTGLHDDFEYEFRVAAENHAGVGPYSEGTMSVRARDPYYRT